MTREEAIKHLSEWMDEKMWRCFGTIDREAIGIAIKALSADTISREEAIHAIDLCRERKNKEIDELRTKWLEAERRADRPIGKWIEVCDTSRICSITRLQCSKCGEEWLPEYTSRFNYCPNCGTDMRDNKDENRD